MGPTKYSSNFQPFNVKIPRICATLEILNPVQGVFNAIEIDVKQGNYFILH
ncbi:hypothetical protein CIPAW_07G074000 [Carya illinoinensis]|uniref:Uncharacterized protein n=1 Tax=Carya illinoinensis TaxID=32201 RepID=A0A8T1Q2Q8_CARIL|nr:hypothetical protein CIPAW_07G074000 [Carya illinoinensis]